MTASPRSLPRRRRLLLAAGRANPQPRHLRAVLLLENRLLAVRFTGERLDAVTLVAGQLAVSWTTSSSTPNSSPPAPGSSPPATPPAAASNATCTTAPSSGWSPRPAPPHQRAHGDAHWGRRAGRVACTRSPMSWAAWWTTCARSRAASTDAALADGGLKPELKASPAAPPSRPSRRRYRLAAPEPDEIAAYYAVAEALPTRPRRASQRRKRRGGGQRRGGCASRSTTTAEGAPTSAAAPA